MSRDFLDEEESFHAQNKKQSRKDRRHAQETDRSKFKKTDQKEVKKDFDPNLPRGRVVAITGEGIWIDDGVKRRLCILKGILKKEKMRAKNLIAVGDFVRYQDDSIIHIEERYSSLARQDISGRKEQLIAVNIDQVLIIASLINPPLKPALIDRYIIAARKGNMHPLLIVNKIDLLPQATEGEKALFEAFVAAYEPLGLPLLSVSTESGVGIEALRCLMRGKASVFSGQSGVGKSSLINVAFGLTLKTGDLAHKTHKGTHTTTTAELLTLSGGGYCIDTPGVRSFGVWGLQKEDVIDHFTEIGELSRGCKFPDCNHIEEPHCAVIKALEEGALSPLRYDSFRSLLAEARGDIDNWTRDKL